ncbi:hypothetical protein [Cupriavidus necator]
MDPLVAGFFLAFQRTEYALKVAGFLKPALHAKADWDTFAGLPEVAAAAAGEDISEHVELLFSNPPRIQIVVGGHLGWQEADPDRAGGAVALFKHVRRVRNNLFHGAKPAGNLEGRDRVLVYAGHQIIMACISAHLPVRDIFWGQY